MEVGGAEWGTLQREERAEGAFIWVILRRKLLNVS